MKIIVASLALLFVLSGARASAHFFYDLGEGFTATNAPDYDTDGKLRPFVEITFPRRCLSTDDTFNRCTEEALVKYLGREAFDGGSPRFMLTAYISDGIPPHFYAQIEGGEVHFVNLVRSPAECASRIGIAVLVMLR